MHDADYAAGRSAARSSSARTSLGFCPRASAIRARRLASSLSTTTISPKVADGSPSTILERTLVEQLEFGVLDRRAADRDLSEGPCSSPSAKDSTLGLGRAPSDHDQPRGRVHGLLDHKRQSTPAVRRANEKPPALRIARIVEDDVPVVSHLRRLVRRDTPGGELVERALGGYELVDDVGHVCRSTGSAGRTRADVASPFDGVKRTAAQRAAVGPDGLHLDPAGRLR